MRFQVPQFIEVEDKIIGPLTFKQFIYVAGSIAVCVLFFIFVPKFFAFILSIPVAAFGFALAFYKVNERPFTQVIEDMLHYSLSSKLYVWKKEDRKPVAEESRSNKPQAQVYVPKLSGSKLKDLSLALDIKENPSGPTPAVTTDDRFTI
jgi:hypothetical protein